MLWPVNNFRTYWEIAGRGDQLPMSLGGNCVFQVEMLQKQVSQDVRFVQVFDGVHVAALLDGKFIDPCLLQESACDVTEEFVVSNLNFGIKGSVYMQRYKRNVLEVVWNYYLQDSRVVGSVFEFDVLNPFVASPDLSQIEIFKGRPRGFFIRFLNLETGFLNVVYMDITSKEMFWTYHLYPSSGLQLQIDSSFEGQFVESLGIDIKCLRGIYLESCDLMNSFWSKR